METAHPPKMRYLVAYTHTGHVTACIAMTPANRIRAYQIECAQLGRHRIITYTSYPLRPGFDCYHPEARQPHLFPEEPPHGH